MYNSLLTRKGENGNLFGVKTEKKEKKKWVSPSARIANLLRERVASLAPGDSLGTEVAIAEESGVSRMTARKAVNELVEEGLVERRAGVGVFVRQEKVTRRWRFVAGNLLWYTAMKAASAARREATKIGAALELKDAGGDMETMLAEIAALPSSGATGAIVFSLHGRAFDEAVRDVAAKGFPVVVIDENAGSKVKASCVVADNVLGGRLVAERVAAEGHSRLAFIGDFVADTVRERWDGFSTLAAKLTGEKPLTYDVKGEDRLGDWETEVRAVVGRIAKLRKRPTAVFCSCDAIARHAMRAFAECGVSVPDEVSLVGYDDDPIAEWTTPALTTVRQDFMAMGREAVKALVARIAKPGAPGMAVAVPVEFISRQSLVRRRSRTST